MAGEQETIVQTGTEAAAPPIETATDEEVRNDQQFEEEEAEGEGGKETEEAGSVDLEDDFEEIEWNGKKFKAPKGLKDGVLMQADYTRKTQEIAATRKELDAERQRIVEQAKAGEEDVKLRAQHIAKSEELEKFRKIDWDGWLQNDPVTAQQAFFRQQTLEREVADLNNQIQQRTQQRSSEAQQELAKRLNETHEYAKANIKGWTPETDQKVINFALEQGVSLGELQSAMNPTIYKILHMAFLGAQVLNKPAAPKTAPKSNVAPLQTVGAKANPPARVSLADADMEQYVAIRKQQMASQGRG